MSLPQAYGKVMGVFLSPATAKGWWGIAAKSVGRAAFLHNVIIMASPLPEGIIMPHYVTKLWEKNYWHELRSVRVFVLCIGQALWLMVCRIFQFTYNFLAIRQSA